LTVTAYTFVRMYTHALDAAANVLTKAKTFAAASGQSEKEMLDWRLIDDMQPLAFQLGVICDFAKQWPARILGRPVPPDIAKDLDSAGFLAEIARAKAYLTALEPDAFEGRDELELTHTLGTGMTVTLANERWLSVFVTTNLYFHLSTAYDICRARGVPLGKVDLFAGGL
jgi:hypothetical protein